MVCISWSSHFDQSEHKETVETKNKTRCIANADGYHSTHVQHDFVISSAKILKTSGAATCVSGPEPRSGTVSGPLSCPACAITVLAHVDYLPLKALLT